MDKYTAVWVSHTSISDFLKCPRAYYLKHVYKDPKTNHKIKLMTPALALGSAVHEVLESLSVLPKETRLSESLIVKLDNVWKKYHGKKGGFFDADSEYKTKLRGQEMLRKVMKNPGPLECQAVKIQTDLPQFWLSEAENIMLCGKIDWLEYLPDTDSVHIIDFKTGRAEEDPNSLQLPIYVLLLNNCQKRKVSKASYWYLDSDRKPVEQLLPDAEEARKKVLDIALQIKLVRQLNRFKCPFGDGCFACLPMETIFSRQAEYVGEDDYRNDVYVIQKKESVAPESVIL
ncbi:MAG: PD-(D/E)XK nuclease family protein [bacterium]|nr:PD-(D/E)XK nuclease family protein [bacterium]